VSLAELPPALVPVIVVVVATLVGAVLWRLFRIALKVVFAFVFFFVVVAVLGWNRPDLARRAAVAVGVMPPDNAAAPR
jgi:hypothetical protein